jgi:hypothetical protein
MKCNYKLTSICNSCKHEPAGNSETTRLMCWPQVNGWSDRLSINIVTEQQETINGVLVKCPSYEM